MPAILFTGLFLLHVIDDDYVSCRPLRIVPVNTDTLPLPANFNRPAR